MTVEFGNVFYILYIICSFGGVIGAYFCLRNKSDKIKRIVLFSLAAFNFTLHFVKLAFPPYCADMPDSLHKASLENICAVSTVLFPFIFLIKKQCFLHDYFYFIGVIGGLAALIYPTEALGNSPFAFDTIRFYICHALLLTVPLLSALLNVYRPRLKMLWVVPLLFLLHELIIMLNEIVLLKTGLIEGTWQTFFDRGARNNSFVHGPTPDLDAIGKALTIFTPKLFTQDVFGVNGGKDFYWPVIWMIGPVLIYFPPLYCLLATPTSQEFRTWLAKRKLKKQP